MRRAVRWVLWDLLRVAPFALARPGDVLELDDGRVVRLTHVGDMVWGVEVDPTSLQARPDRTEGVLSVRPDPTRRVHQQDPAAHDVFSARG